MYIAKETIKLHICTITAVSIFLSVNVFIWKYNVYFEYMYLYKIRYGVLTISQTQAHVVKTNIFTNRNRD